MWRLSRKDPEKLDLLLTAPEQVMAAVPEAEDMKGEPDGAYFPEATREDFERQEAEDSGMSAWLDRLKQL